MTSLREWGQEHQNTGTIKDMAAIQDPETGTAAPPQLTEAPRPALPRDPARATAVLYRKYGTAVYRFSWHMLGSREDAEDAAQATFLAVHAALANGTDVREPQAWVMKIARNECLQKITQRMRRPLTDSIDADEAIQLAAAGPSVARQAELNGELGAASEALGRLPTSQREAFVLREWVGMSTAEVAVSLGTTVSAVDALLNRARRELIRVVGGNEGVASCAETRAALADGLLDRSARAHLVRCKSCRAARRAVDPQMSVVRSLVPPAVIAERLASSLPGFASGAASGAAGAAGGAAAGGTGIAAVVAKLAATPAAIKVVAAAVTAAAAVGGGIAADVRSSHPTRHAPAAAAAAAVSRVPEHAAPVAPTRFASAPVNGGSSAADDSGSGGHQTTSRNGDGATGSRDSGGSGDGSQGDGTRRSGDSRHHTGGTRESKDGASRESGSGRHHTNYSGWFTANHESDYKPSSSSDSGSGTGSTSGSGSTSSGSTGTTTTSHTGDD
jgi:RNA polymerase sigma factor (sigma-70 family)